MPERSITSRTMPNKASRRPMRSTLRCSRRCCMARLEASSSAALECPNCCVKSGKTESWASCECDAGLRAVDLDEARALCFLSLPSSQPNIAMQLSKNSLLSCAPSFSESIGLVFSCLCFKNKQKQKNTKQKSAAACASSGL